MNDKEYETMLILQEECAEVIQAVSKCFRFGIDQQYQDRVNRQRLEQELGDLLAMVDILCSKGVVDLDNLRVAKLAKIEKLHQWSNIFTETQVHEENIL